MKKFDYDVIVIGGGPSGISAAKKSSELGSKTLLIERDMVLGGILNQCIHNGFGLKYFKEELTGPEYATRLTSSLDNNNLSVLLSTFVTEIGKNHVVVCNSLGTKRITFGACVLASGCRERTAGMISLVGNRVAGIYTAGFVQKMINHNGKLPGKKAVILGSGDIGLIMARRLTFEGVKVEKIFEIMPVSSGLQRNIKQCVIDFDIPLLFNITIVEVVGKDKVEGVWFAPVDEKLNPILDKKQFVECDCVLLSVGLIPEIDLVQNSIETNPKTKGAIVDEWRQTSQSGLFSSGNCLHIHDLADNASLEGEIAGQGANMFANKTYPQQRKSHITNGEGIQYVIPNYYYETEGLLKIFFRANKKMQNAKIVISSEKETFEKPLRAVLPGEMCEVLIAKSMISGETTLSLKGETK